QCPDSTDTPRSLLPPVQHLGRIVDPSGLDERFRVFPVEPIHRRITDPAVERLGGGEVLERLRRLPAPELDEPQRPLVAQTLGKLARPIEVADMCCYEQERKRDAP